MLFTIAFRSSQAPTAVVCCTDLQTMMATAAVKQFRLVNRSSPLLLHNNQRPLTVREIVITLQELQLEILPHPPYSPDRTPTDHFVRDLYNFRRGKSVLPKRQYKMLSRSFSNLDP